MPWMNPTTYDTTRVTVELGELIDNGLALWEFDYPSFYEGAEKTAFEQKVIDHYRFRQIGSETVGRWLHQFRTRVREIMPYYIQLYKSVAIMDAIDDPFGNVDVTETFTRERSSNSTTESNGTSNETVTGSTSETTSGTKKFSNTPQGSIDNLDNYMSEATVDNGSHSGSNNQTVSGTGSADSQQSDTENESYTMTKRGNQGVNTYAHDMKEFREIMINVDLQVIEALNDLFLKVY